MTLEELYEQIGGDYAEVLSRLRMEKLISKFIVRFLEDPSCEQLIAAHEAGDEQALFEAAHTAKGVCANLSLPKLSVPASEITEALRPGNEDLKQSTDLDALVSDIKEAYEITVKYVKEYAEQ